MSDLEEDFQKSTIDCRLAMRLIHQDFQTGNECGDTAISAGESPEP
jgi:hypothetical protein